MIHRIALLVLLGFGVNTPSYAAKLTQLHDSGILLELGGQYQFTNSQAGSIPSAVFSQKMTNPYLLQAGFSYEVWKGITVGLRASTWLARQRYELGVETRSDTLTLHQMGPEFGFQFGNPRMRYRLVAAIVYPLTLKVVREGITSQTFTRVSTRLVYEVRFQSILKVQQWLSWVLEGGYRLFDLGVLQSGSESFVASGASLDVSGPFIGTGIGIHF
ncbi:hypothetical protein EBQ90_07005 [bacterium]|nr:hypothetical protein [bacterium]